MPDFSWRIFRVRFLLKESIFPVDNILEKVFLKTAIIGIYFSKLFHFEACS